MDEKPLSTLGSGSQGPLQVLEAASQRAHPAQPAHSPGAPEPGPARARKEQKAQGPGVQEAASCPLLPSWLGFLLLSPLPLRGCRRPGLLCERGWKEKLCRAGRGVLCRCRSEDSVLHPNPARIFPTHMCAHVCKPTHTISHTHTSLYTLCPPLTSHYRHITHTPHHTHTPIYTVHPTHHTTDILHTHTEPYIPCIHHSQHTKDIHTHTPYIHCAHHSHHTHTTDTQSPIYTVYTTHFKQQIYHTHSPI